ncbi:alpha-mannosidase [Ascoidea rubescens DSM 1968]|uniref:Alpha-mannosidase n=1 Tax=Ascoidea rubescens DSM 1968 TaxID=1344418 RepID=A0A1D2VD63_9ASCO|nr:glycoside hydrolase family 38 protein [Ascoidea rubescens DSM 1968]ODV59575.1 glycoside hydrolase family 38 protein [Ascoidea rubescens DSM 1968]
MVSEYATINNNPVFKHVDSIYENRLRQFFDNGQYRDFNLPKFMDYQTSSDCISLRVHSVANNARPLFKDIIPDLKDEDWSSSKVGDKFGPSWATFWFKIEATLPSNWLVDYINNPNIHSDQIWFRWDSQNEGLIYDQYGTPLQALTGNGERIDYIVPKSWYSSNNTFKFYLEMACNGMFGNGEPTNSNNHFSLNTCQLVIPNLQCRALYHDFHEIADAAREFPSDSWQKHQARKLANQIMNTFDPNNPDYSISLSRNLAKSFLGNDIDSSKVFTLNDTINFKKIEVFNFGNCHIDTAWLWPFAESRRKIVRSWTTQLNLIERYPEYIFVASQMQQFKWLKEDHLIIFNQIKSNLDRFIPIGGTWVENDTNLPASESLARQFLKGQFFLKQNFDFYSKTFWLPDSFGYSSQLPQLCQLSKISRFLTQKLSWNNINTFPLTTFNWVALDGSQILAHMPPNNTYTSAANFGDIKRSLHQHKNLAYSVKSMHLAGHGDGGGGCTPEMLERIRRCRGIANTSGELPYVHSGISIDKFYDLILDETKNGKELPSWVGELYFEFHRGTYTTQSDVKNFMRWVETNLHSLEYLSTLASLFSKSYIFPAKQISDLWENVLLCQFHDVLPGTCIELVYSDEVKPMLSKCIRKTEKLIFTALTSLGIKQFPTKKTFENDNHLNYEISIIYEKLVNRAFWLINTYPWNVSEIVKIPKLSKLFLNENQKTLKEKPNFYSKLSFIQEGRYENDYVLFQSLPDNHSILAPLTEKINAEVKLFDLDDYFVLDNSLLKIEISKSTGVITSIIDKTYNDKEFLDIKTGKNKTGANQFVILQDTPLSWQAWDTELFSLEKIVNLNANKVEIYEQGPLITTIRVSIVINEKTNSWLNSYISLNANSKLINIENECDWHENCRFLKVEFPVDIHNSYCSYETQFGITTRPTNYNTSYEVAKFETCCHKFVDYSDFTGGVSIFNNNKYGFSTHGNLMRLSLLRSPKSPDEHADMGKHFFKYGIFPHKGGINGEVVRNSFNFNTRFWKSDDNEDYYKICKFTNRISNEEDYRIEQTGFGSCVLLENIHEFNKEFFNFISLENDEGNLILSNIKRAELDSDVFVDYNSEALYSEKTMKPYQANHQQSKFLSFSNLISKNNNVQENTKSVIIRVYDSLGGKSKGVIVVKKLLPLLRVYKVNNLEEDVEVLEFSSSTENDEYTIQIELRAFEIAGYRLVLAV